VSSSATEPQPIVEEQANEGGDEDRQDDGIARLAPSNAINERRDVGHLVTHLGEVIATHHQDGILLLDGAVDLEALADERISGVV